MTDKFAVLETHKKATPGPWAVDFTELERGTKFYDIADSDGTLIADLSGVEENARHIATWSPDVTAEVVELLREAESHLFENGNARAVGWNRRLQWQKRLDALLAKVKERNSAG